ncbi:MAG: phage terminase large subunit [Alphaproteobacteria bacterium]|nr:phage terminase large subunit [Alphaproteobacteria bacterium]
MTNQIPVVGFRTFLVLWNRMQGRTTPMLHIKIAGWLEAGRESGETRSLLMAFRSAGKSTIVGLYASWLLYRDPDLRILVLAADNALAGKMVRNVKRIIERHPLTAHLKPEKADQWASDRFTVSRALESRDPSMLARGVGGNITGSRADIVICDDVEVPATCDSAEKRENLRTVLGEMAYVLVAGGAQLYIGTPHDYYSIYADTPRTEIGEEREFLSGFSRLQIPILNEKNQSAWPERYTLEDIERLRAETGPGKFESQMMLKPVNIMESRLNPDLLRFYDAELEYARELDALYIGPNRMAGASCRWDPAFGSAKGDDSVLAIVFGDEAGNYYLHHLEYIRIDPASDKPEAEQQCEIVAGIAKEMYLPSISVENNGIGIFLPGMLRNALTKAKSSASVREEPSTKNKAVRIIEGFETLMAAGRLYVHKDICRTPFLREMREWRPGSTKVHDDALDAVAGALSGHPDRLTRIHGMGKQSWMTGAAPHTAKGVLDEH